MEVWDDIGLGPAGDMLRETTCATFGRDVAAPGANCAAGDGKDLIAGTRVWYAPAATLIGAFVKPALATLYFRLPS